MEKIKPFMWVIFDDDGDYETNSVNKFSCGRSGGQPLYTREALEAALEVMKRECMFAAKEWAMMHVEVDHAPHGVDDEISKYVSVYEVLENSLGE